MRRHKNSCSLDSEHTFGAAISVASTIGYYWSSSSPSSSTSTRSLATRVVFSRRDFSSGGFSKPYFSSRSHSTRFRGIEFSPSGNSCSRPTPSSLQTGISPLCRCRVVQTTYISFFARRILARLLRSWLRRSFLLKIPIRSNSFGSSMHLIVSCLIW